MMLVLKRKETQVIRVGKDIRITIQKIRGSAVSVGVDAPGLEIVREEAKSQEPKPGSRFEAMKQAAGKKAA